MLSCLQKKFGLSTPHLTWALYERAYETAARGILSKHHKFCFYTIFLPGLQSVCFWAQILYAALEIQKSIKVYPFSRERHWSARQLWMLVRQPSTVIRALLWQPGFPLGQVIQLLCVSVYLSMKYRANKSNLSSITHKSKSVSERESHFVVSDSWRSHGLYSPWNSPGQNTGVSSLSLLRGSSQPRDWTQISNIAGGFFTSWATV